CLADVMNPGDESDPSSRTYFIEAQSSRELCPRPLWEYLLPQLQCHCSHIGEVAEKWMIGGQIVAITKLGGDRPMNLNRTHSGPFACDSSLALRHVLSRPNREKTRRPGVIPR